MAFSSAFNEKFVTVNVEHTEQTKIEAKPTNEEAFKYQIHHVFLPPELPQKDDTNPWHEKALMETVGSALKRFESYFQPDERPELNRCIRMVSSMIHLRDASGFLNSATLDKEIVDLRDNDTLVIHIRKQNAGLLVTRIGDEVLFECFELLARNEDVMSCKGRLRRHFPGPTVAVKRSLITDVNFRQHFVDLLVKLDRETGPRKKEEVERAKAEHIGEEVHSVDPWRVTEMVMGLLRGLGEASKVERIIKHTREEALWEGKQLPWHRSPLWLLIRVSLQLTLESPRGKAKTYSEAAAPIYKDFMVFLMSHILSEAQSRKLPHDLLYVMMAKVSRRLMKLGRGEKAEWLGFTEKTMQELGATMNQEWENIQSGHRDTLDLSALQTLNLAQDTQITMDNLRPYLTKISSPDYAVHLPKAKVVEGPSFLRNEKNYLPKSNFSQERDFMFYELADFESWVSSNLQAIWSLDSELPTHGTGASGTDPHRAAGRQLGSFTHENELFPYLMPKSFHIGNTIGEDGYTISGLESSAVQHLENLHREDKLLETGANALVGPVDDKWSYTLDNSFATNFFKQVGGLPASSTQQPFTRLCDRCSNMRVFDAGFQVYLSLSGLWESAAFCGLCRLLHRVIKRAYPIYPVRPVRVYREGSNLIADGSGQPILRICADPDHPSSEAAQIGFPSLPKVGSTTHFSLLHEWLRVCNEEHKKLGCHADSESKLPTRVLYVGDKQNPGLLRLYCTNGAQGSYVALSHCWGKPTEEERQRSCTFIGNIADRCQMIDFKELAKTFQDAVTVTRELGKQFLWIDSLCIVQNDPADWEREAKLMETVFSEAYCTIAATSAGGSDVGFLGPRPPKEYIRISGDPDKKIYLCETVDDFTGDVANGVLNKRGWVYQERALSRRMIHFTANQTYWECGKGIHCETMTRMKNPKAQFLGDPQFPMIALRRNHAKRIQLLEMLFKTYSKLGLTVVSDRSFAIAGLERRVARALESEVAFGIIKCYGHRSLFWRRSGDKLMRKIVYPKSRRVPSWSWMAYDGIIDYSEIPTKEVEWSSDVQLSFGQGQNPTFRGLVVEFNIFEIGREKWRLVLDVKDDVDIQKLRCVILGRQILSYHVPDQKYYVLLVLPSSYPYVGYERVGMTIVQKRHLMIEQGGAEVQIV